jgi:hypothetical protein
MRAAHAAAACGGFVEDPDACVRARGQVLRQMLSADAAIYVIDCLSVLNATNRDLSMARPIMHGAQLRAWQAQPPNRMAEVLAPYGLPPLCCSMRWRRL